MTYDHKYCDKHWIPNIQKLYQKHIDNEFLNDPNFRNSTNITEQFLYEFWDAIKKDLS